MKQHLRAALATITMLVAGAAGAADLPSSKYLPEAPPLPSFYSWTGFYAGVQAGYSWERDQFTGFGTVGRVPLGVRFKYGTDTAVGGAHAGFNYQIASLVLGAEADIEAASGRGGFTDPGGVVRVKRDWQASVRGRIGWAFDRILVYGTGGVAFTDFDYSYYNPAIRLSESTSASKTGWTVGGGVNYAVTDKLIVGVDYRYTDFGSFDHVARSAFLGLTAEQKPAWHTVRASLAYKF